MSRRLHTSNVSPAALWTLVAVFVLLGILVLAPPARAATAGGAETSVGRHRGVRPGHHRAGRHDSRQRRSSFGGSATIAGTVRNTVVGIGADVTLQPSAKVGHRGRSR